MQITPKDSYAIEDMTKKLVGLDPKHAWPILYGWVKENRISCGVFRKLAESIVEKQGLKEIHEYVNNLRKKVNDPNKEG